MRSTPARFRNTRPSLTLLSLAIFAFSSTLLAQDPQYGLNQTPQQPQIPGQPAPPIPGQIPDPSTQDSSGAPGMTGAMMQDKMFLRKAVAGGLAEVQFGQLAAHKASSDDVKAFAQQMVTDHTALNQQLSPFADSIGVMLPRKIDKQDQAELDKLNTLTGSAFDTEYLTLMVRDHHQDLREFRLEIASTTDDDLKATVARAAFQIPEHSVAADKLARAQGIPLPSHNPHDKTPDPPPPQ